MPLSSKTVYKTLFSAFLLIGGIHSSFASGSYNTGSSGGGEQAYNLGKAAVYKKLLCSGCPLAGQDVDSTKAVEIIQMLNDKKELTAKLTETETEGVMVYLKRRYELN
ncbi:MAG: hypothetical protein CTY34_11885 [Methylobacter sp.]|nr:MAG: hypothetical protein CTY34_11885 [Methylobacter sp.]PPD03934.1 MAG: hypothetical protein CTY29_07730 [Methylobacter sp.]PPD22685.1 MAG: hypothetical protein CTY24_06325 [Methylobacter sp.]PPD33913.1 MAG: hypothetical protein CTY18_09165 [Methylomonas sp.]